MSHKWEKDEENDRWTIVCSEKEKWFSPDVTLFKKEGLCPYCLCDAKTELEKKKREKMERQRQKEMNEEQRMKNTLQGYF